MRGGGWEWVRLLVLVRHEPVGATQYRGQSTQAPLSQVMLRCCFRHNTQRNPHCATQANRATMLSHAQTRSRSSPTSPSMRVTRRSLPVAPCHPNLTARSSRLRHSTASWSLASSRFTRQSQSSVRASSFLRGRVPWLYRVRSRLPWYHGQASTESPYCPSHNCHDQSLALPVTPAQHSPRQHLAPQPTPSQPPSHHPSVRPSFTRLSCRMTRLKVNAALTSI